MKSIWTCTGIGYSIRGGSVANIALSYSRVTVRASRIGALHTFMGRR
jgi:hypothetical protein